MISFRIVWFALLAVQGTLKSFLQHHSLKASILWHSAFFMVQLSHPYMTTGKTVALTIRATLSRFVTFSLSTPIPVPTEYCSLQYWTLLSPPDTATTEFLLWPSYFILDKSRQYIKKQRNHFADKGPHSQS